MLKEKLFRLIIRFEQMILMIHKYSDINIHQNINEFFYLQKIEELRLFIEIIEKNRMAVFHRNLEEEYQNYFCQWRQDYRWLSRYLNNNRNQVRTIL